MWIYFVFFLLENFLIGNIFFSMCVFFSELIVLNWHVFNFSAPIYLFCLIAWKKIIKMKKKNFQWSNKQKKEKNKLMTKTLMNNTSQDVVIVNS